MLGNDVTGNVGMRESCDVGDALGVSVRMAGLTDGNDVYTFVGLKVGMRDVLDVGFFVGFTVGAETDGVKVVASIDGSSVESMEGGEVG